MGNDKFKRKTERGEEQNGTVEGQGQCYLGVGVGTAVGNAVGVTLGLELWIN
jgi:hypothetical protein